MPETNIPSPETLDAMPERKRRLVEAAMRLILRQGYAGTTVDQVCTEAAVTKGAFFHYFASKEQVCRAAMDAWTDGWQTIVESSGLDRIADPLARLEALFDVMENAYLTSPLGFGCVIGTVAQETGASNRALGDSCAEHLDLWAVTFRHLLSEAKATHPPRTAFDPASVTDWLLGMVQGTLLVAKTRQDPTIIVNNLQHCRAYVRSLFGRTKG